MKVTLTTIFGVCAVLGLAAFLIFPMFYRPTNHAPNAETVSRLAQAEIALRMVQKENPSYLERFTATTAGNQSSFGLWRKMIDDNLDIIVTSDENNVREKARLILCFDAWTNEFNVFLKEALPRDKCSRCLLDKELLFVVWSSGSNRSNEFGKGDDVAYERPKIFTQPGDSPNDGPATPVGNSEGSGGGRHR